MGTEMNIELLAVDDIRPNPHNSRLHSASQISDIVKSIKEFGWTIPLLIDEDGLLLAGHGRLMAAKKAGVREVPCVRKVGLTPAQKRAYVIADNQLGQGSTWDEKILKMDKVLPEYARRIGLMDLDLAYTPEEMAQREKQQALMQAEADAIPKRVSPEMPKLNALVQVFGGLQPGDPVRGPMLEQISRTLGVLTPAMAASINAMNQQAVAQHNLNLSAADQAALAQDITTQEIKNAGNAEGQPGAGSPVGPQAAPPVGAPVGQAPATPGVPAPGAVPIP